MKKIKKITKEQEIDNTKLHPNLPHSHAIEFNKIHFSYKRNKMILNNVSIAIHKGTFTTILGPNGSGKSTLVKTLMKENKLHSHEESKFKNLSFKNFNNKNLGSIKINGTDIHKISTKDFGKVIAYIPQIIEIPEGINVFDFVAFGRIPHLGLFGTLSKYDKEIIDKALKNLEIFDLKFKDMNELSGGQRQKALVALALAQDTEIIVLDEPTTFLDIKNQHEILDILDKLHLQGKTILAVLHDINQAAQYSDYIYILKDGKNFIDGKPDKVITADIIKKVYGVKSNMYLSKGRRYISNVEVIKSNSNQ